MIPMSLFLNLAPSQTVCLCYLGSFSCRVVSMYDNFSYRAVSFYMVIMIASDTALYLNSY
jgi:hypothetical protein